MKNEGAATIADSAPVILVKGAGDVGSAVAHALFRAGYRPLLVDSPKPSVVRRWMAFADALFVGRASLEGVVAERADTPAAVVIDSR